MAEDLPVQALIDVHCNIIDGLRAQQPAPPVSVPGPAGKFSSTRPVTA
jgi:hypothetical protein